MQKIIPTLLAVCACAAAGAQDMGKLLATGGVSQVEGAGGGGITPWALISGYGTRDSWGANAHYTHLSTQDYKLHTYGVTAGIADRLEVSFANQEFTGSLAPLDKLNIKQDIVGLKLKVLGDAVYEQDVWLPQVAIGGIGAEQFPAVLATGVGSIAVVRALVNAADPEAAAAQLMALMAG